MKRKMSKNVFLGVLFLAFASTIFAQKSQDKKTAEVLDEFLTRMSAFGFGGAVIIEKNDQIILRKGYGYSDAEKKIPFTADTPYPVNSISKQFTAASILKLAESGKLSLNDSITKFLTDVPDDKKAITIHQLLTHTSGFGDNYAGTNIFNREEAVKKILEPPLANPVGSKMVYSNDGYELLAAIVEIVSGQTLPDFVRQNFFIPAGMKTAGFQGEGEFWKDRPVAHAYNSCVDNGSPQFQKADWDGRGAGDIVVSANDLFKWELSLRKNEILSAGMKQKMFTPYALYPNGWYYGYGWFVIKSERGTTGYYHGGGDIPRGYTSSYNRFPADKTTVIIFSNTMIDETGFLRAVKDEIIDITFGKKIEMPPDFAKIKISDFGKYPGIYQAESGENFVVIEKNNQLMLGATEQKAINFLTSPDEETEQNLEKYNKLSAAFIKKNAKDESAANPLQPNLGNFEKLHGKYKSFEILGTYPVSYAYKVSTTYAKLDFENGADVIRFVRRGDNTPYQLTGNPFPALTPIMPRTEKDFVAFYPLLKKIILLQFESDDRGKIKSLQLIKGDQSLTAVKL